MSDLDIAQVAKRSGVPASTLRFYEGKGLVAPIGRRGPAPTLRPLGAGAPRPDRPRPRRRFSLDEIGQMFAADGRPRIDRDRLLAKADELELTIRRLSAMRDGLRHAAACPAPSHAECPHFRRIVRLAGEGLLQPRPRRAFVAEAV